MEEIEDDEPLCWTCKHGKWDHLNGSGACGQCSLGCPAYAVMTPDGSAAAGGKFTYFGSTAERGPVLIEGTPQSPPARYSCCAHCTEDGGTDHPGGHAEPCKEGCATPTVAGAELVRQYREHVGPLPGDPFDPDLWMHAAAELLNGGTL